jgi:hypothetical protein
MGEKESVASFYLMCDLRFFVEAAKKNHCGLKDIQKKVEKLLESWEMLDTLDRLERVGKDIIGISGDIARLRKSIEKLLS